MITTRISSDPDRASYYINPLRMVHKLWAHRSLINQLTVRQLKMRYQGSYLGVLWAFLVPLATLIVYTFVFSVIFQVRWEQTITTSHSEFALILFAGLIVYTMFSESVLGASGLIVGNTNYVKRVVFPLEVLVVSHVATVGITSLFSIVILVWSQIFFLGYVSEVVVLLPLMYLPLVMLCLGTGWFIASLGVFVRDMTNLLGVFFSLLFFITPIIYPISMVPENLRFLLMINPLTPIVTMFRQVILFREIPDIATYFQSTLLCLIVCLAGYVWFMKSKKGFADVL